MGFGLLAVNNFVVELWLHLSIIQTSLILRSVCTNLGCWLYKTITKTKTCSEAVSDNVYRLPITVYRLPITVYRLPFTVYRLTITD